MTTATERPPTLNSAEGICEDVLTIERGKYKGQQIIFRTDTDQYFAIDCKQDADTPKPDEKIRIDFWCNGRRWRKEDADDWKYFTSLNLSKWESVSDSSSSSTDDPF